jgi:hypothetical protein
MEWVSVDWQYVLYPLQCGLAAPSPTYRWTAKKYEKWRQLWHSEEKLIDKFAEYAVHKPLLEASQSSFKSNLHTPKM